jgi:aspartyl protease family protein
MLRFVIVAVVTLAAGVMAARYVDQRSRAPAPSVTVASAPTTTPAPAAMTVAPASATANFRTMEIRAGRDGHFQVEARVDGRRLDFVIDTGASQIALRESDAARLGIHPAPRDYSVKVNTANGIGRAALVELRMVEIGNIVVRDVKALVHPDEALSVNLLGMSFLSRVRWTHERGMLVLEQ